MEHIEIEMPKYGWDAIEGKEEAQRKKEETK